MSVLNLSLPYIKTNILYAILFSLISFIFGVISLFAKFKIIQILSFLFSSAFFIHVFYIAASILEEKEVFSDTGNSFEFLFCYIISNIIIGIVLFLISLLNGKIIIEHSFLIVLIGVIATYVFIFFSHLEFSIDLIAPLLSFLIIGLYTSEAKEKIKTFTLALETNLNFHLFWLECFFEM